MNECAGVARYYVPSQRSRLRGGALADVSLLRPPGLIYPPARLVAATASCVVARREVL